MNSVCVFCGSSVGRDPFYLKAAASAGDALARAGLTVVYGGGKVGLMGAVANAALDAGGRVVGVMPRALAEREIAHARLSELHVVETMHERKATMSALADGFLALPGGPARSTSSSSSGPGRNSAFTASRAAFST